MGQERIGPSNARGRLGLDLHLTVIDAGQSSLVRAGNGRVLFTRSKEGATQGNPLAMVACGVALLRLIRLLKAPSPDVHQPWRADDAGAGGQFKRIRLCFEKLQERGPPSGLFPGA